MASTPAARLLHASQPEAVLFVTLRRRSFESVVPMVIQPDRRDKGSLVVAQEAVSPSARQAKSGICQAAVKQ